MRFSQSELRLDAIASNPAIRWSVKELNLAPEDNRVTTGRRTIRLCTLHMFLKR